MRSSTALPLTDPTPQPNLGSGPMAGSDPLLSHFTMPIESACCCLTCPQLLRRCSGPRPVLRPQPGSSPSLTTKASPSYRTICIAPCAAACASPLAITSARCGGVDWPGCGRPLDPLGGPRRRMPSLRGPG